LVGIAEGNINYRHNRLNIGKYLRDKSEHYQQCVDKYCKNVNGDERALSSKKVLPFLKELFSGGGFQLNI
jgi:hypothetical protein